MLMLHLFVAPTPFEGWGEYPYDGTTLLLVIVSLGALTLTVCLALVMLLSGEPLELPDALAKGVVRSASEGGEPVDIEIRIARHELEKLDVVLAYYERPENTGIVYYRLR